MGNLEITITEVGKEKVFTRLLLLKTRVTLFTYYAVKHHPMFTNIMSYT